MLPLAVHDAVVRLHKEVVLRLCQVAAARRKALQRRRALAARAAVAQHLGALQRGPAARVRKARLRLVGAHRLKALRVAVAAVAVAAAAVRARLVLRLQLVHAHARLRARGHGRRAAKDNAVRPPRPVLLHRRRQRALQLVACRRADARLARIVRVHAHCKGVAAVNAKVQHVVQRAVVGKAVLRRRLVQQLAGAVLRPQQQAARAVGLLHAAGRQPHVGRHRLRQRNHVEPGAAVGGHVGAHAEVEEAGRRHDRAVVGHEAVLRGLRHAEAVAAGVGQLQAAGGVRGVDKEAWRRQGAVHVVGAAGAVLEEVAQQCAVAAGRRRGCAAQQQCRARDDGNALDLGRHHPARGRLQE